MKKRKMGMTGNDVKPRWELDYDLLENEGLFGEYLEMGTLHFMSQYTNSLKGSTFDLPPPRRPRWVCRLSMGLRHNFLLYGSFFQGVSMCQTVTNAKHDT